MSETSSTTSFNNLTSAASSGSNSAISDLRTYVNKLKNGEYVAEADLSTKVDEKMAGFVSKTGVDTAVAQLFASDTNTNSKAAVSAMIQDGISEVVVNADKIALIADAVNVDADTTISGNI